MSDIDIRRVARLAADLAESQTEERTVDQVVELAVEVLGVEHGGVTLMSDRGRTLRTVGATAARVEKADLLQYDLREGPCVDAAVQSRFVASADLAADDRWPRWGPAAADLGFGRILSAELHARDQRLGALNLYGADTGEFDPDDCDLVRLFARQAAAAVFRLRTERGLEESVGTRTVIGQAQGILMERFGIDAERAFEVLRRYSQDRNVKLREVAEQVIATASANRGPAPPG